MVCLFWCLSGRKAFSLSMVWIVLAYCFVSHECCHQHSIHSLFPAQLFFFRHMISSIECRSAYKRPSKRVCYHSEHHSMVDSENGSVRPLLGGWSKMFWWMLLRFAAFMSCSWLHIMGSGWWKALVCVHECARVCVKSLRHSSVWWNTDHVNSFCDYCPNWSLVLRMSIVVAELITR